MEHDVVNHSRVFITSKIKLLEIVCPHVFTSHKNVQFYLLPNADSNDEFGVSF